MKRTSGNAVAIIIPVVVIIIIGILIAVFWNRIYDTSQKDSVGTVSSPHKEEIKDTEGEPDSNPIEAEKGSISGNIRYPIEWMTLAERNQGMLYPKDMRICALDYFSYDEITCKNDFEGTAESYLLSVKPGAYVIRATTGDKVAYYDPYVSANDSGYWPMDACSEEASTPIVLPLKAGQELTQIDAADFWVGHLGC